VSLSLRQAARPNEGGPETDLSQNTAPRWVGAVALTAIVVEWVGFYWDIARHGDVGRDTFFALPTW